MGEVGDVPIYHFVQYPMSAHGDDDDGDGLGTGGDCILRQ
jgi:hypothetical protein